MSSTTHAGHRARHLTAPLTSVRWLVHWVPLGAWVAVAGVVAAAIVAVELTGAIAGLLHSQQAVLVDPVSALGVLAHWLGDTGVRRGAWPADVAADLGRYRQVRAALVLAVMLVAASAVGCFVMWRSTRVERLREVYKQRGARWAKDRELARLHVKGATPGRVTLGQRGSQLLASEANASTLIVAPAQAGKTSGLAVPAMVEWDGPILATSVKGDLLVDTLKARRAKGEVKVFDPTDSTTVAGSAWSPVAAAKSWSAARRLAASILQIGMRQHGGQDDSFWRQAGASHLAPLLLAGNFLGVTTSVVLKWATSTDEDALSEPLGALGVLVKQRTAGADTALHDLKVFLETDSRYRSNVIGTLSTYLDAWKEPALETATAHMEGEGITPEWLLDGNNTLYLSAPAAAQRRLRGLFCALVTEIIAAAFERAARTGRPLDPRLLLMMDEAANIAPLPNIDEIASTGPGQGVLLCTILQNLSQAEEVWGKDRADTILANHRARLFGAGIGDTATLEYISRILGDEVRETASISRKRAALIDLGSRSESLEHRALLGNHETRQLAEGHALLVYGQLPPTQLELRPWFKDRALTRLVEGTPTKFQTLTGHGRSAVGRVRSLGRPALRGRRANTNAERPQRRVGVTLSVQLGGGRDHQLRLMVQGTPSATAAESDDTGSAPITTDAVTAAAPVTTLSQPVASSATSTPAKTEGEQLDGQLTLDEISAADERSSPAVEPAGDGVRDVRSRFDRHLGRGAGRGVSALRLAAVAGDLVALGGAHALVLRDADEAPASSDWLTCEAWAPQLSREEVTRRLLVLGASCAERSDEIGPLEQWTNADGSRLVLRFATRGDQLEAIAGAESLAVDGIGALRVLGVEQLGVLTRPAVVGD